MFSWLKKTPKRPPYNEKVWISKAYKYQGLYNDIQEIIKNGGKIFIFTHFEKTSEEVAFILEQMKINHYLFEKEDNTAILSFQQVAIFHAISIQSSEIIKHLQSFAAHSSLCFYIIEHFPLQQGDDNLLTTLTEINPAIKPTFYTALDDPTLKPFITDTLTQTLEKLGLKPEESISHPLVSKAIIKVQEKLEKQVKGEKIAYSVEDWLKSNL